MTTRRAGVLAAAAAALAGISTALVIVALGNTTAPGRAIATVGDDYYAGLKVHPRVVEPVAGDTGGTVSGSYRITEPSPGVAAGRAGAPRGPGPPSDAQVRSELAQARKQRRVPAFQNPAGVGPVAPFEPAAGWHTSVASVFYDYGGPLACGGRLAPNQLGVAHRSAPCGALITFRYGGRVVRVPVIDRGPYIAGREWDLTGATAQLLGFPGLDFIDWTV
jgi:Lytic transglycolase